MALNVTRKTCQSPPWYGPSPGATPAIPSCPAAPLVTSWNGSVPVRAGTGDGVTTVYANATGVRSSRAIECHCRQDVAYRVITGNVVPDHATIASFVVRHERALAGLFSEVLRLCDQAGLVKSELIAIDGTRMAGNANQEASLDFGEIAREILVEHKATDEAEDERWARPRKDDL
jgi:hypothetical protein